RADEVYVADLDAIAGAGSLSPLLRRMIDKSECRTFFWIDSGIRSLESFAHLTFHPIIWPVIAFETANPEATGEIARLPSRGHCAFSIDMRNGELVGDWRAWGLRNERDALGLACQVVKLGIPTLIVLDLARVGTGTGSGTEALLREIRSEFPHIELIA